MATTSITKDYIVKDMDALLELIDTVWEISATAHPCLDKGRKALENYGR